ncbi:transposase, IS91 family, putative [Thioalkalivibrio nitratireducens DSM 14787]|uniref:Transposase, IS91 family, putative n=1 Tax=Thioalkalivibrio nitratireducens (strain DSM 14787 / UNIQEM 213 / ALEN2) TaxID=1255043 RepID=L0DYB3_THIND|nr:IS91 family transposase [Thioalkalivibrio nitratireducens]AGA33356.1 transposase, IS91 family, putative [Thioalkalivibrio nitratireducens DSM 14787]
MAEPATLQQALYRFLHEETLDGHRRRVCQHLKAYRTEALGGMQVQCEACGWEQPWYHGCRVWHCPQCQTRATRVWAERQQEALLPVRYFHVVFTLPHALNGWVQLHPEVLYRLLFQVTWDTLRRFGQDRRRLGSELGMTVVLHTWGQNLSQHAHLHCLIPGGALLADGHWKPSQGNTLFPVRALSRRFRGAMVAALRRAADDGELHRVTRPGEIDAVLDRLMVAEWVVYAKDCLDHTPTVVDYLARYTHRIAISNARILDIDAREVAFRYTDYRDHHRPKVMRLEGEEFVRRFLLHILPKGLMRVRHYGFLANRCRRTKLPRIRSALNAPRPDTRDASEDRSAPATYPCPRCRVGRVCVLTVLRPRLNRTDILEHRR